MRAALPIAVVVWSFAPAVEAIEFTHRFEALFENTALYRSAGAPAFVRDIPPHSNDTFLQNWRGGPIEDEIIDFRYWTNAVRYLAGIRWHWLECQAGPTYFGTFQENGPPVRDGRYGTYRGGDSFDGHCDCARYYELHARSPVLGVRLVVSASTPDLPVLDKGTFRLRTSLEIDPFGRPIEYETGWDRYNRDEVRAFIKAGRLHEFVAALRLEFGSDPRSSRAYLFVDAGLVTSIFSPRDGFDGMTMKNRDHFRFALGFGWSN